MHVYLGTYLAKPCPYQLQGIITQGLATEHWETQGLGSV